MWRLGLEDAEKPAPALSGGGVAPVTTGDEWLDGLIADQWAALEFDSSQKR